MAVDSKVITVATTATLVHTATGGSVTLTLHDPSGGQAVYLGPADVTADTNATTGGLLMVAGEKFTLKLKAGDSLYARVAATTQALHVLVLS